MARGELETIIQGQMHQYLTEGRGEKAARILMKLRHKRKQRPGFSWAAMKDNHVRTTIPNRSQSDTA